MTGNFTHTNGWFFFLWFLNEQRFTFWQVSYKRLSHGWFIWKWKWSLKHLHPRKISLTNENFYQPECLYSSFNFLKKKKEKNKTKKPYLHAENLLHEERFKTRNRRATHAALPGTLECLQLQICRQTRLLATPDGTQLNTARFTLTSTAFPLSQHNALCLPCSTIYSRSIY